MENPHVKKIEFIKEEGKIFNSLEFSKLGEFPRELRYREIVKKIIKYTRKTLTYENIALWELRSDTGELLPLFSRGYGSRLRKYRFHPGLFNNGIVGYVAHVGYPYIARDLRLDPHYLPGIKKARSSVTVPFKIGNEVFGVLNIESQRKSAFNGSDIEILREYASHVAIALSIRRVLDIGENITINRIAKTIAHEVNNPLESIFMTMSKIDTVEQNLSDAMIEYLRVINQNLNIIQLAIEKMTTLHNPRMDEEYEMIDIEGSLRNRYILVVEDEDDARELLADILRNEGCRVDSAPDGPEGISLGLKNNYDIIITDIKMPTCSGYEVFRRIREKKPKQKMLMVTGFGYDEDHTIVKGTREGLDGVLYKPFKPHMLIRVLLRVCS